MVKMSFTVIKNSSLTTAITNCLRHYVICYHYQ